LVAQEMSSPRKVFRIEETAAARPARGLDAPRASFGQDELIEALNVLRAMMGPAPAAPQINGNSGAVAEPVAPRLHTAHLIRIDHELDAVVSSTEQASQKILAAAEEIDQLANNLSAALKGKIEQGLAQDISDLVIRIFEVCNFQDLTGQRITKVMTAIRSLEAQNAPAAPAAPAPQAPAPYLHGPRLEADSGHVTQAEIDAMFGS
jgi:chemotaxis regulatin CheY-phosphate phosphatase CheZ